VCRGEWWQASRFDDTTFVIVVVEGALLGSEVVVEEGTMCGGDTSYKERAEHPPP